MIANFTRATYYRCCCFSFGNNLSRRYSYVAQELLFIYICLIKSVDFHGYIKEIKEAGHGQFVTKIPPDCLDFGIEQEQKIGH